MRPSRALDKVIVLDRDGTVVIDRGYLSDPDGLEFEPFAAEGLRLLYTRGYRLVVVTNQSGVGRGLFPVQRVLDMNARLQIMAKDIGVEFEGIYFCPHTPEAGCECRKPAVGLMTQAAAELGFDPACAVVIGDKQSDVEFGYRAGAAAILIDANTGETRLVPPYIASNLREAARIVEVLHAEMTSIHVDRS